MGGEWYIPEREIRGCEGARTWHTGPSEGASGGDLLSVSGEALGGDEGGGVVWGADRQSCSTKAKLVSLVMAVENPMYNFKLILNDGIR